jgi:aspartate carbamoyltransferase catalytic subunit
MPVSAEPIRHFLALEGASRGEIAALLDQAETWLPVVRGEAPPSSVLAGKIIANLFLEDSTRTRGSFTVAAHRLGATTLDLSGPGSSLSKGETITDTARNIDAMGVDAIVIRCGASGAAAIIAPVVGCPVINAGDGRHEHPTQGLLDLLTLRRRLDELEGRVVAIVGDIAGSRVARSAIHGLTTMGADVQLIGPPTLVPRSFESIARGPGRAMVSHDLDAALPHVDAIMMLRVQFERGSEVAGDYRESFGLTAARAARLPSHAVILHPGPINRGLEMDGDLADDPRRSVILDQVTLGVAVRMAVLAAVLV